MSDPWLSVLIPTYNGEGLLPLALDSIIEQNDHDIECIAIDDGSTDRTLSILVSYQKKLEIKILHNERQGNWVASTNYALSLARGEYTCFLHQDDIWLKNRISTVKSLIRQFPDVGFLLHASNFVDHEGNKLGPWRCPLAPYPALTPSSLMIEKLLVQNFISIPAPIFKRALAIKVGGLDETLWYTADWDFWLKIAACSDTLYYPYPLSGFRIQPSSQTVLRSSYLEDFRNQLETVIQRNLPILNTYDSKKSKLVEIAKFSMQVNIALAGIFHGERTNLAGLLLKFLFLGPSGWLRYLKDSRIWERVSARLRAKLMAPAR